MGVVVDGSGGGWEWWWMGVVVDGSGGRVRCEFRDEEKAGGIDSAWRRTAIGNDSAMRGSRAATTVVVHPPPLFPTMVTRL